MENPSLSLSISFLAWWKKTYKKRLCVCEREREREREILRDSKGKIAMGEEKNRTKKKSSISDRESNKETMQEAHEARGKKKKKLTEFSSIVVVVAATRKKGKTVGVKGDEIGKKKTGVHKKR